MPAGLDVKNHMFGRIWNLDVRFSNLDVRKSQAAWERFMGLEKSLSTAGLIVTYH